MIKVLIIDDQEESIRDIRKRLDAEKAVITGPHSRSSSRLRRSMRSLTSRLVMRLSLRISLLRPR